MKIINYFKLLYYKYFKELNDLELKINSSSQKILELEQQLFQQLVKIFFKIFIFLIYLKCEVVCSHSVSIMDASYSLAGKKFLKYTKSFLGIDVASSLALLAVQRNYSRPIVDNRFYLLKKNRILKKN